MSAYQRYKSVSTSRTKRFLPKVVQDVSGHWADALGTDVNSSARRHATVRGMVESPPGNIAQ
jgi:hypothetical protein